MGKIVFLDVDGTLINYDAVCPESAFKAVEMARANGHKVYSAFSYIKNYKSPAASYSSFSPRRIRE